MIKVGTDCSGIGAPEQALKNLKIETEVEFACEIDKNAKATYLLNHSAKHIYEDITTRDNKNAPYVDLYVAGFPCQAFSIAGHGLGFEDTRGTIFFNCAEYIKEKQPKFFVLENVRGLLSHDKKNSKQKYGKTFSTMMNLLSATINGQTLIPFYQDNLGYNVHFAVLNAKDFGVPQNRERVFIVGIRPDLPNTFSFPAKQKPIPKLLSILEPDVDEKYFLSQKALDGMIRRKEDNISKGKGFGFRANEETGISNTITRGYYKDGHDSLLKIKSATKQGYEIASDGDGINYKFAGSATRRGRVGKQLAQTLETEPMQAVYVKGEIRRFTPRECLRLQGFPDTFNIEGVLESKVYQQAGNSMPVKVLERIFQRLLSS